jgi:hypothetical protein
MTDERHVTGAEAGMTGDQQIRIALERIMAAGGEAQMSQIYEAVDEHLRPMGLTLSQQGRASLRRLVNHVAVEAGYIYPHDKAHPGWRITPEGREFLRSFAQPAEITLNVDTGGEQAAPSRMAQADAFERWVLRLLQSAYPYHSWYHQGAHKHHERGLDLVGTRIGEANSASRTIGVQVKLHQENHAPQQVEWLKFLAGCFARRVDEAIFITTGRLTGEQRRESQEAGVVVIEGLAEIHRIAKQFSVKPFTLVDKGAQDP